MMFSRLRRILVKRKDEISEFERNNPLGFGGERVDFIYDEKFTYSNLDMYQKNHFHRYEFSLKNILKDDICGDFACGAGYGTVMISTVASKVIGVDINEKVINEIRIRYKSNEKVEFKNCDLLDLDFYDHFDKIISFETIEHFNEENIYELLNLFNRSLKAQGKIVFSTPYMQEESEEARKMGFHLTFKIDEERIRNWLGKTGFINPVFYYQDYKDHEITDLKSNPDFIICIADKK